MHGCDPLCNRPATHVVTYRNGTCGPFGAEICGEHYRAMRARAHPGLIEDQTGLLNRT
jgi:hypothetical protein